MKPPEQFHNIRIPDELKSAILGGVDYKPVKLNNVTLDNLRSMYQSRLDECEDDLEKYYEHGLITLDVDNLLHFKAHGIELTVPSKLNVDRDSLIEILLAVLAVYDRKGCKDLIEAIKRKVNDNITRMSVNGISAIAEKVLEDARHTTQTLDGVQLNEDGKIENTGKTEEAIL